MRAYDRRWVESQKRHPLIEKVKQDLEYTLWIIIFVVILALIITYGR